MYRTLYTHIYNVISISWNFLLTKIFWIYYFIFKYNLNLQICCNIEVVGLWYWTHVYISCVEDELLNVSFSWLFFLFEKCSQECTHVQNSIHTVHMYRKLYRNNYYLINLDFIDIYVISLKNVQKTIENVHIDGLHLY